MNKPQSLRSALNKAVPYVRDNPDKLHLFVDDGVMISSMAASLSWEYRYTLNVIVTDFSADQNLLMAAVIAWLRDNQPDILANPDSRNGGFTFEAVILKNDSCDISMDLRLTERVLAIQNGDTVTVKAISEPDDPEWSDDYWLRKK